MRDYDTKMNSSKNLGLVFIGSGMLLFVCWWLYLMMGASKLPVTVKAAIVLVILGIAIILASMSIERVRKKK